MTRAIIKIPSAAPIDITRMGNRGLDEWLGHLPPDCVGEVVGLCCVEEAGASDCVEEAVAEIVEIDTSTVFYDALWPLLCRKARELYFKRILTNIRNGLRRETHKAKAPDRPSATHYVNTCESSTGLDL